jgi:hypothetical protein
MKLQGDDEMISEARLVLQNASQQDPIQSENFRGKVFVKNEEGLRYAEGRLQTETMQQQLSSVQQRLSSIQQQMKTERVSLLNRIDNLEEGSTTLRAMRDRFLSIYKRDKLLRPLNDYDCDCISAGHVIAHGGNAKYDATLYDSGRTDYSVYIELYGLHPTVVSTSKSTNLCIQSW